MHTQLPDLLTPAEAAAILRVDASTLRRYGAEGRLRRVMLSPRTVRYPAASVEALINGMAGASEFHDSTKETQP